VPVRTCTSGPSIHIGKRPGLVRGASPLSGAGTAAWSLSAARKSVCVRHPFESSSSSSSIIHELASKPAP